jgi:hypothetical protein
MSEQLTLTDPTPQQRIHWTGHIGYDSTPGHRPADRKTVPAVGDLVTVAPAGFIRDPEWTGRILSHIHWRDGSYTGLSVAECVDAGDFPDWLVVGNGYQVEAPRIRPVQDGDGDE